MEKDRKVGEEKKKIYIWEIGGCIGKNKKRERETSFFLRTHRGQILGNFIQAQKGGRKGRRLDINQDENGDVEEEEEEEEGRRERRRRRKRRRRRRRDLHMISA